MKETSEAPGWAQALIGACLGAASLWALRTDVLNNLHYFQSVNAELADILAMSAVIAFLLPALATIRGWSKSAAAFTTLCVAIACWSSLNVYLSALGQDILDKKATASRYEDSRAKVTFARGKLAQIAEQADAATLDAMAQAAKSRAEDLEEADTRRMGGKACFSKCQAAGKDHEALLGRFANAKARDLARADLDRAEADAEAVRPAEASALAAKIATQTGGDATDIALWIAIGTAMAGIAVTQGALLLAHSGVSLIASGGSQMLRQRKSSALERKAETIRPSPEPAQGPPRRGRKASTTREQALEILRNHAKMNGGALFASKAAIADALGVSRTTACDPRKGWVAHWERTGAIELTKTRKGISVRVADNMAA